MHFSNLDCVISQEVVHNELKILTDGEESQDLSIVIQELLFG